MTFLRLLFWSPGPLLEIRHARESLRRAEFQRRRRAGPDAVGQRQIAAHTNRIVKPQPPAAEADRTDPSRDKDRPANKERGAGGRFAPGNAGGPGNPYARQVAQFRSRLMQCMSPEQFDRIAAKLIELAEAGDVPAMRLLFSYLLGKPTPPPAEPDHVDLHEMNTFAAEGRMLETATPLLTKPSPELPLRMLRQARPLVTQQQASAFLGMVSLPRTEQAKLDERMAVMSPAEKAKTLRELGDAFVRSQERAPSTNGGSKKGCAAAARAQVAPLGQEDHPGFLSGRR